MPHSTPSRQPTRASIVTQRALAKFEKFMHIEALSGVILLFAACAALILANSPYASIYNQLWHTDIGFQLGSYQISWDLHFWVNDGLMTVFFLVAGMEIRREIHEGALSSVKQAALPIIAAIGGVCLPAFIYLAFNSTADSAHGWAIPTATDIAFAIGILALLGKSIPSNLRVILLSLAIIDDIIAVLIIAIFYSNGIAPEGITIATFGILLIIFFQWIGIARAWFYVIPGAIIWFGLMKTGVHPSLAGIVLGMMTPVLTARNHETPLSSMQKSLSLLLESAQDKNNDYQTNAALKKIRTSQRDYVAPVTRVQMVLHPWVVYAVMPIFAFANAGVSFSGIDFTQQGISLIVTGVAFGLILGKPFGIILASFYAVKLGLCRLPPHVNWSGILLIGFLAGIGFTMAIFVSMLAFHDPNQLSAAKIGVLSGSGLSALIGLIYGSYFIRRAKREKDRTGFDKPVQKPLS